jgi:anti-sigma28 factor (negative regulator of flagellin synthesis)
MFTQDTTPATDRDDPSEPIDRIDLEPNQHVARIRALLARGEYVVDLDQLAMAIVTANARRTQS